jgi:serine/threonine protein kinase
MPAPTTVDDYVQVVRRSGLVESQALDQLLQQTASGGDLPGSKRLAALLVEQGLLTRFQAEQTLQGKWRGYTLGKYRVLERLGSGGMGNVYLCEHMSMRRRVAIKVLPSSQSTNPSALGRFYREARAAGSLDHPNLVKAHDVDQDNGLHFLVMDYVDGANLQSIVSRFGPLAIPRAAEYIRQTALGLQSAHENGLVHRDVKPANILVDRGGTVRLLDLGLARFFHDESDPLTLKYDDKHVLGTADYVAPEQALNSHTADIRSDIYSLGCTFYFLLTGQVLFPEGKVTQKLMWHQVRQPPPVRKLRSDVPQGMAEVIARMLAKDAAQRFQTPAEVAAALEPWTREPLPPPPEAEMPRLSPAARSSTGDPGSSASRRVSRRVERPASSGAAFLAPRATPSAAGLPTPCPAAAADTKRDQKPLARSADTPAESVPLVAATSRRRAQQREAARQRRRKRLRLSLILAFGAVVGLGLRLVVTLLR